MNQVLLKDESRWEDNSPGVNNTTTQHDITLENDKRHVLTRQMILLKCLLDRRVQNRIKLSRNSPKATSESGAGRKKSNLASTAFGRLYQLILFPSVAFSPFSLTTEVIQRQQLQGTVSIKGGAEVKLGGCNTLDLK